MRDIARWIELGRRAEDPVMKLLREIVERGHGELKVTVSRSSNIVEITQVRKERIE